MAMNLFDHVKFTCVIWNRIIPVHTVSAQWFKEEIKIQENSISNANKPEVGSILHPVLRGKQNRQKAQDTKQNCQIA